MKKQSFSLIAVLAIALAVTTAFTTKKEKAVDPQYFHPESPVNAEDDWDDYNTTDFTIPASNTPVFDQGDCGPLENLVCAIEYDPEESQPEVTGVVLGGYTGN